jgi:Acetyltransferase (GNAT) domain
MPCAAYPEVAEVSQADSEAKAAYCIDPLEDRRWDRFLVRHPRASIFHSSAWLKTLSVSYGYQPVVYTTSPAGQEITNGLVFCRVESWLTGRRLVSLPFSDHCEPLVDDAADRLALAAALDRELPQQRWRYIELRPLQSFDLGTALSRTDVLYSFHQLDLRPDLGAIFRGFHKDSIQRKIRRAEREGLVCREGSTEELLDCFYSLFEITRRRHRLPPQPRKWFVHLMECLGGGLKIRVAFHQGRPVAAMITIRYKDTLVYKYGCSETRYNYLGSMPLLYWKAIQEAKDAGLCLFDLGRTDAPQRGLIIFKNRWGSTHSTLTYSRYGVAAKSSTHLFDLPAARWKAKLAKLTMAHFPTSVLSLAGRLLYRHIG